MTERTSDDATELLTKRQFADELGVSVRTVDRYIKRNIIRTVHRGPGPKPRVFIERSQMDRVFI